jgi:trigger factor
MESTVEETAKHTVRLTVEIPPEEFTKDLDHTYRSLANQVKVPGFRKGKVPRQIIDAQVGRDAVIAEFLQDAVPGYYTRAVREHELAPIADPEIELDTGQLAEDRPLVFTATVEVRPRLTLSEDAYKGLVLDVPPGEITEADIDEFVDRLRDRFAELETVSHPARRGDYVVADIRGTVHDREIPEATRVDHLYEVGSGELVPKLDEELQGRGAGEIVKFNETLPDAAGEQAGQEVSFTVLVKEVKAKRLPDADDEFARTASEFDTLAELREDLREKLGGAKEREREGEIREAALQALVDAVDVDLPDRLVDAEVDHRVRHAEERARAVGVGLDQLLEAQGWDELRFRSDARAHAIRAVKADLALEAVARAEGLTVTPEELSNEVARLAQAVGRPPREVAKSLERSGGVTSLAGDIIRTKALDLVVDHAEVPGGRPSKGDEEPSGDADEAAEGGSPRPDQGADDA